MTIAKPTQVATPFANSGLKNSIPQSATGSNLASLEEGFPAVTMAAVADGGTPPQGQDFNGILNQVTNQLRYSQAGGLYPYDSTFCTAIGGYPLGAILMSADGSKLWQNQVAGNANDPDSDDTNWTELCTVDALTAGLATKQNTLTFDSTPTANSSNPVTSGGTKTALDAKQDTLTFDSTPTANSNNPVTSQGIKAAIDAKDSLPSQTGHAGEYLKTDGETASWSNVESLPSQTGNAGKVLTTDGTTASWSEPLSGRQILETFYTFRTDVGPINGAYDANGTVYNRSDFSGIHNPYDLLVAGKAKSCSFAEYETQLSTYGSCGLFGLDTETQRFRVPTLKNILEPTVLSSAIGQIVEAGLPNIEGNIKMRPLMTGQNAYADQAFDVASTATEITSGYSAGQLFNGGMGNVVVNLSASRSNPIYGKSTTVQPQTIKVRPMVQLATAGQEISIEQYEQQLSEYARTNTLNGRLIGEIIQSALPLTDAGVHLLDGSQIQNSGIYAQFCTYVANLQADYPDLFCTEAEFTASVEAYGSCGKFVNGASYIRLPKVSDILQGTTDVTAVGDLIEAGLPNITGSITKITTESSSTGGAISATETGTAYAGGSGKQFRTLYFNASRSSTIYGKSTTVQPQTIKALLYICVATAVKTQIQVDIDNIATDLNGKADRDFANVTKPYVVEEWRSGANWYRRWSSGEIEQGGIFDNGTNARANSTTLTFKYPFTDTNFDIFVSGTRDGTSGYVVGQTGSRSKSKTGIYVEFYGDNENNLSRFLNWRAKGRWK